MRLINSIVLAAILSGMAAGQIRPELPKERVDTSWHLPAGKTWTAHNETDLKTALRDSKPGDVITLDAGKVYTGNFIFPVKTYNPAPSPIDPWIYIISSEMSHLPAPGTRVDPTRDSAHMPKIVSSTATATLTMRDGAKYLRIAGIEMYSASTGGCKPTASPPVPCFTYSLVNAEGRWNSPSLPDHLTVDRCYLHGSPTIDVREGVFGNAAHLAVVDSYISDIHQSTQDSQAVLAYASPGPILIRNNYLEATGENVMFGGSGGSSNPYQPSDIEIRDNYFYKPLKWAQAGVTLPPKNKWTVKNLLEFKSGRRVLVEGNTFENNWKSGQDGAAIVLTVRSGQSGNSAVVDDILFENNTIKNVPSGFSTLASDYSCGDASSPNCTNPGESKRVKITNNAIQFMDPSLPYGARNSLVIIAYGLTDYEFSHNSTVVAPGATCWNSIYFNHKQGQPWPPTPPDSTAHNIWILNNALCRQPTGDNGSAGQVGLARYMGDPPPVDNRFKGNVIFVSSTDKVQSWPATNTITQEPMAFTAAGRLASPKWTETTTGKQAGYQGQ